MHMLSDDAAVSLLETTDVGGTTASTGWVSMANFMKIFAYVELGTWNAGDDLDHCRIEQAQDDSGTGAKDLTSDESGGDYDTDYPIDADGNFVILEARQEDMDVANGFTHVRLTVGEDGNTGTDNVTGFLLRYDAIHKAAQLNGAASAGAQVYVRAS
jgi:hypothetical protein